mmetsp:Transcript_754/g.2202  ORF Transcript_754/g.2202 Transcript_754/m.2202 type:complete len:288 (+) Transcript_754:112-975(+)
MGAAFGCTTCGAVFGRRNQEVPEDPDYDDPAPAVGGPGAIFMVICTLDYKNTTAPLSCSVDGRNMLHLAQCCMIPEQHVVVLVDEQCTKENVANVIWNVGQQCRPLDYFIFYYSGHAVGVADLSGDESDGQDEAFCFVDDTGKLSRDSVMIDDDFAEIMTTSLHEGVRTIILTDCCHSGTIADFNAGDWHEREAISISGCLDSQKSGDIGCGGIFTHSMLLAIADLTESQEFDYSVGRLFNETLDKDRRVFNSRQDITLQCAPRFMPNWMAWPLIPRGRYLPPYKKF